MIFANVRELKARASEYIRKAKRTGGVVVVSHGKPTAALIPLDEDSFDDYLLEHHQGVRTAVDASFAEHRKKGGRPIERLIADTKRAMGR